MIHRYFADGFLLIDSAVRITLGELVLDGIALPVDSRAAPGVEPLTLLPHLNNVSDGDGPATRAGSGGGLNV